MFNKYFKKGDIENTANGVLFQQIQARRQKQKEKDKKLQNTFYTEKQLAAIEKFDAFKTHKNLVVQVLKDENRTVEWLRDIGFIAEEGAVCPECIRQNREKKGHMHYYKLSPKANKKQRRKGGYILKCRGIGNTCRYSTTPFAGSFFDGVTSKLPLGDVLQVIYLWSRKTSVKNTAHEVDCEEKTIVDYFNYLREVCTVSLMEKGEQIIGGEGLTVEIDESKFFKNKYGKGRAAIDQKKAGSLAASVAKINNFSWSVFPIEPKKPYFPLFTNILGPAQPS